jgi:hypothetical protein
MIAPLDQENVRSMIFISTTSMNPRAGGNK